MNEVSFTYEGKEYPSYYALSKVMGLSRATIKYRHENLGIPIDEVKNYVKPKPLAGFEAVKSENPKRSDNNSNQEIEIQKKAILTCLRAPSSFRCDNPNELVEWREWIDSAPILLVEREYMHFVTKHEGSIYKNGEIINPRDTYQSILADYSPNQKMLSQLFTDRLKSENIDAISFLETYTENAY